MFFLTFLALLCKIEVYESQRYFICDIPDCRSRFVRNHFFAPATQLYILLSLHRSMLFVRLGFIQKGQALVDSVFGAVVHIDCRHFSYLVARES